MAWSAVSSAVTTLGKLLTEEATYLWGVEEQVDRLQTELKWMQSFLKDAEARRGESQERIRMRVAEVRELAYDAEDVVEAFALEIASKRKTCLSKCACMVRDGWMLHKTRSEIEKIMARITDLTRQLKTYGLQELRVADQDQAGTSLSSFERQELRRPYPHIVDDHIVGFHDDINKLVSILVDDQTNWRVVSICGMGGLGKTTLAKRVYHHSHVRNHFNHFAWVYVSQRCQRRKVWEDTLSGLISWDERGSKRSDEELAERLFNFLKDGKCLVILDDIWSTLAWDSIHAAFPTTDETQSKILLTSRNREVASHAASRCYLHELECLKEKDSWELLQKIVFPNTDHAPEYRVDAKLEKIGKEMIKHCAGLPLAITVLGEILANKHSTNEWQIVCEDVKSCIKRGKGQGTGQGTEEVLALSYDDLPPHLKSCFLYLSHFPEDYEMRAYRLIQLWVAEGIVSSHRDERNSREIFIEDVAECYLDELVQRCMIQVEKRDVVSGKIKTCRMHDLMRELCLSEAIEENFLYIFDDSNVKPNGNGISSPTIRRVRRVAAQSFVWPQSIKNPHLRSLLLFDGLVPSEESFHSLPKVLQSEDSCIKMCIVYCILFARMGRAWTCIFNNLKLLRVLNIQKGDAIMCKLSKDIGNLIHLRFLNLRNAEFVCCNLPSSLGNLTCLRSLDLRVSHCMFQIHVPDVIWRLEELRHLYLPYGCKDKTKLKLGTLKNLLILVNFSTDYCYVEDLRSMIKLRELQIYENFHIEDLKEDLDKNSPIIASKCLRSLSIVNTAMDPTHLSLLLSNCANLCELGSYSGMEKLPNYDHLSSDIAYIHLHNFHSIDEDPMPTLEKLPNLKKLKFDRNAYQGKVMVCSSQRFLRLDSLILRRLGELKEWEVEEGAMPALRHLEIASCQGLKMLPHGLKFITTLKELKIENMPKAFKDRVVEGGEDCYKVHHIPSIIFRNCDD